MAHRIKLTRYAVQNVNYQYFGAYRLRVVVESVEGDGLDPYIFVFRRGPIDPYLNATRDDFQAIVGPAQLGIPIGEPDAEKFWPFYRTDSVELDFASETEAMEVWTIIQAEARILCEALAQYQVMLPAEEVWLPDQPDLSESESVSV